MSFGESEWGHYPWGDDPEDGPIFDGLARLSDPTSHTLTAGWDPGSQDGVLPEALVYELHWATAPAADFIVRATTLPGVVQHVLPDLRPNTLYYVRARCRGPGGAVSAPDSTELAMRTAIGAPTVANVQPAVGATLSPGEPVNFDVLDDVELRAIMIFVKYPGAGPWEVAYDGTSFAPAFAAGSEITGPATARHVRLRRSGGGWLAAPLIDVRPVDESFAEVT